MTKIFEAIGCVVYVSFGLGMGVVFVEVTAEQQPGSTAAGGKDQEY